MSGQATNAVNYPSLRVMRTLGDNHRFTEGLEQTSLPDERCESTKGVMSGVRIIKLTVDIRPPQPVMCQPSPKTSIQQVVFTSSFCLVWERPTASMGNDSS
ncbi:hypothetical protein HCH54_003536 [Aspergillus fumigatus]